MRPCLRSRAALLALGLAAVLAPAARAQLGGGAIPPPEQLVRVSAPAVEVRAGASVDAVVTLAIAPGWHINANPPSPDYMIPTALELRRRAGLAPGRPVYPPPQRLRVEFEDSDLLVLDGQAAIRVPITAAASAANGVHALTGVLRFQACNDQVCLAPAELPVRIEVTVSGGAAPGSAAADTAEAAPDPAPIAADTVAAGAGAAGEPLPPLRATSTALNNPLVRSLEAGRWQAWLLLFVFGLGLNLTPCVYPMIGVTVSMFGARRAAPPAQVFGMALVYVLGMAVMYSGLGLAAAFTGGLFGGLLQHPAVQIGLGVLMIGLSLSMFGLYEFQPPAALMSRLGGGGTVSVVGMFLSGLVVGIIAAPCVGPFVSTLLLVVGAKGDPQFGFTAFFVLAMGLGAPYLVLAMFSNLMQRLPRSGEWMVWVKKVFGVILLSLGAYYALMALAPGWALWVAPAALILGGAYLGFLDRSGRGKPTFRWVKRATGALAATAGAILVVTTPTQSIAFESFTPEALELALREGKPALLDFTANWCAPCHELERFTFSDRRVRERARAFRAFRVDLTRYNTPEAERWRRRFAITGVPTVVFISPEGREVEAARVEGFVPPEMFLERMALAAGREQRASRP